MIEPDLPTLPESSRAGPLQVVLPIVVFAVSVIAWDLLVRLNDIPPYVLPGPLLVFDTLIKDRQILFDALGVTLVTTLEGFVAASVGGILLALVFNTSRVVEYSFYPYAVILQVTPVIAIAPLLLIYLPQQAAVVVCAWIVAFFPVLANTTLGLNSVDKNLADLFQLYGASTEQKLRIPEASGGLAAPPRRLADRRRAVADRRGGG